MYESRTQLLSRACDLEPCRLMYAAMHLFTQHSVPSGPPPLVSVFTQHSVPSGPPPLVRTQIKSLGAIPCPGSLSQGTIFASV